jgi:outer membrane biosynthesis protein TonB
MLTPEVQSQNRKKAMVTTVAIHASVFLLLFFLVVFRPPDPPITMSMYGVEVDFGVDDEGSGEIRSLAPANTNPPNPDARAGAPEESVPEPREESRPAAPAPTPEDPPLTADDKESPVEIKEPPKIERPILKKEEPRPETIAKNTPPSPEQKPVEEKKVNPNALFTKKDGAGGLSDGTSDRTAGNNNGDDEGKVGDKGDPRGIMGGKNYSGTPGTGGGSGMGVSIQGWKLQYAPREKDPFDEGGRIIFVVKVDEDGNVVDASVRETTVSPEMVAFYKKQAMKMRFEPKEDNASPAPISTGTVTFTIVTK